MQQGKKRKLVDRLKNVLNSFLEYMRLDVDDNDFEDYYEDVETTRKERVFAIISIGASLIILVAGIVISIGAVVVFILAGFDV